jgi:hypothetical protein
MGVSDLTLTTVPGNRYYYCLYFQMTGYLLKVTQVEHGSWVLNPGPSDSKPMALSACLVQQIYVPSRDTEAQKEESLAKGHTVISGGPVTRKQIFWVFTPKFFLGQAAV